MKPLRTNPLISRLLDFDSGVHFVRPMVLAVFVGIGTGFLVVAFIKALDFAQKLFFGIENIYGQAWVILIPVLGGLLVGPLVTFLTPEAKGHGVPEVLKAIALRGGRIRPVVVLGKAIGSIISIGSGFSVGREGPIVQMGAAFGSTCGQVLRLSESQMKNLVACGAASGIAGVFNTPIAGVLFAAEVILRDFGTRALSTVVVAAVFSSIISRVFLGDHPSFIVPSYHLEGPFEIVLYFVLGVLAALVGVLFMLLLERSENWFERWRIPAWLKPAAGGLIVGCCGFFYPQIFGSGLSTIEEALHGSIPLQVLLMLIFLKIFATSVSLGAGSSGGVFAPLLFMGAVLGGAVGNMASQYHFTQTAPAGAYALVGMASVFAGAARAPITAILIVFEMTGGYGMILPIMIAAMVSTSLSQLLLKESVYLRRLKHEGIDIRPMEEARIIEGLRVSDAMSRDFTVVREQMSAKSLMELMNKEMSRTVFVLNQKGEICGTVKLSELNQALIFEDSSLINIHDLMTPLRDCSFVDEPLNEAARLMGARHLSELPVVDSLDITKIVGVLRSDEVFRVYSDHVSRRSEIVQAAQEGAAAVSDMKSIVFTVTPRCPIVGKMIKDLDLPEGVHFDSVKRAGRFLIPHGKITITLRDKISASVTPQSEQAFAQWLKTNQIKGF